MSGKSSLNLVACIGAVPLLSLCAAAPGGGDWRWLEFPWGMTATALVLFFVLGSRKDPWASAMVPFGTAGLAVAWKFIGEYLALMRLGRAELFDAELDVLFGFSAGRLAPWLMGGLYGLLALLTIGAARRRTSQNFVRASAWLVLVGAVTIGLALATKSWLTLENLTQQGTFRSSSSWPDTQVIAVVLGGLSLVASAVLFGLGNRDSARS